MSPQQRQEHVEKLALKFTQALFENNILTPEKVHEFGLQANVPECERCDLIAALSSQKRTKNATVANNSYLERMWDGDGWAN